MPEPQTLLWLVPGLCLLGAVLAAVVGRFKKELAPYPVAAAAALAFLCSLGVVGHITPENPVVGTERLTWFDAGVGTSHPLHVALGLAADGLTGVMLLTITFIGFWIVVFSIGYMHHDPGYARYFSVVGLFLTAMTLLVTGDNFLALFAGWEGVGLCSYLLVGFWYYKPSAALAARKAFLVTRLGDVFFLLGIFLLWAAAGYTVDFAELFKPETTDKLAKDPDLLAAACLLIFCGAAGKSAQVPLFVWLPDAMEGPTPVSALIHAATMVTAGVYLLARCMPLFALVPWVQATVAAIGGITALVAAFIALAQHDLKRVLAYSTVSQLGYMFMGLGCAGHDVAPTFAVTAAIFHLFTHAFFKAVLFLSAGSVMHAMGDVIDMRKFGGLRKLLPLTHFAFLMGALALAGFPLLSGFWSKDMILEGLLEAGDHSRDFGTLYFLLFVGALLTAGLTAFYTFRAYFRTFSGPQRVPAEAGDHAHESPPVMTAPLVVLAVGAIAAGFVAGPLTGWVHGMIDHTPSLAATTERVYGEVHEHELVDQLPLMAGSALVALLGIGGAYVLYGRGRPAEKDDPLARKMGGAYFLSQNKLYVDEVYEAVFAKPLAGLAALARHVEGAVWGVVQFVAFIPAALAGAVRPLQNGLVQFYALSMVVGVAAFIGYLVLWPAGK